jgi:hypothetical protein
MKSKLFDYRQEMLMEEKQKKKYEKPTVRKIKLDAKTAVLGFCKNTGFIGPGGPGCGQPGPGCNSSGS